MTDHGVDLERYLDRVRLTRPRSAGWEELVALHEAHLGHIPFENLDVRLGRPVRLDLEALEAKLVRGGRGGYCFEQNTLFAAALRALGFTVATLEARVRPPDSARILPRTHMTLRVEASGRSYLADVGFGGDGPLHPVPLDGEPSAQPDATYRVIDEGDGEYGLRREARGAALDLYGFTLRPALPADYELANYYTSTHPQSRFVTTLTVQRSRREARDILRGNTLIRRTPQGETGREVVVEEIPALLRERFGLAVRADEATRAFAPRDATEPRR